MTYDEFLKKYLPKTYEALLKQRQKPPETDKWRKRNNSGLTRSSEQE